MPSTKSSKLSPVILEAMARTLSDHDLLRFMLSSKEAFKATLDALSTVDYINYHDQNFEGEPCVSFRMRRDDKNRVSLNYITKSNPLFDFIINYVKSHITKFEIGEVAAIDSWILNWLMTSNLHELSLGVELPEDYQYQLKDLPNVSEIRYPSFDLFFANCFVPDSCKKVIIDYIDFRDFYRVAWPCPNFYKNAKVESFSIGEAKLFLRDYNRDASDFFPNCWRWLLEFFRDSFPTLKTLNINLSGRKIHPFNHILTWFNRIKGLVFHILPPRIEGMICFNILITPSAWLAAQKAFNELGRREHSGFTNGEVTEADIRFNKDLEKGFKIRRFPSYFNSFAYENNATTQNKKIQCSLHYYAKWEEYDFDALNNEVYGLVFEQGAPLMMTAREHTEADDTTQSERTERDDDSLSTDSTLTSDEVTINPKLFTARDDSWSLKTQSSWTLTSDSDQTNTTHSATATTSTGSSGTEATSLMTCSTYSLDSTQTYRTDEDERTLECNGK